jgi:hypothetical protein
VLFRSHFLPVEEVWRRVSRDRREPGRGPVHPGEDRARQMHRRVTPTREGWSRDGAGRKVLAVFVAGLIGGSGLLPARATEDPCIATYDRQGNVTGRYCPDGTTKPPPAGKRAARAPDAVDPEQSVPGSERKGGRPAGGKPAPKGGEIQCGQWKTTAGNGCRGIFTILR